MLPIAGVTLKVWWTRDKVPRAWVVLSPLGRKTGKKRTNGSVGSVDEADAQQVQMAQRGIEYVDEVPLSIQRLVSVHGYADCVCTPRSQIHEWQVFERKLVDEYEKRHKASERNSKGVNHRGNSLASV